MILEKCRFCTCCKCCAPRADCACCRRYPTVCRGPVFRTRWYAVRTVEVPMNVYCGEGCENAVPWNSHGHCGGCCR